MNMQASAANHPSLNALIAYGDGEAAADVVAHIATCPTCAERAEEYTKTQVELRRTLYRFDCPDAHTLGEYQLNLLRPEQRTNVAAHTVECDECRADLDALRKFLAIESSVPESLVGRARRLVATLFTPSPGLALSGLRGTIESTTRLFEVEDVTISVGPGHESNTLIGLVVVTSTPSDVLVGGEVRLVPSHGAPYRGTLDDLGNFEFADVTPGSYALEIDLPDTLVVVQELRVD